VEDVAFGYINAVYPLGSLGKQITSISFAGSHIQNPAPVG
jgi:hypothetical protein